MDNRRRTRNFFPEPKFQIRFLAFLLTGSLLQVVIISSVLYYFVSQNYTYLVHYAGLEQEIQDILNRELRWFVVATVVSFSAYLAGVTILGVLFSHRIAGAIYSVKRTIKMICEGKDVELKFRDGDEFRELATGFNEMVRQLKSKDSLKKVV